MSRELIRIGIELTGLIVLVATSSVVTFESEHFVKGFLFGFLVFEANYWLVLYTARRFFDGSGSTDQNFWRRCLITVVFLENSVLLGRLLILLFWSQIVSLLAMYWERSVHSLGRFQIGFDEGVLVEVSPQRLSLRL